MRARTALVSIACVVGLALAGCSSDVAGSPQLPGGGVGVTTGDDGQPGGVVTTTPAGDRPDAGPSTTSQDDSDSGDGGDSSLPPATGDDQPETTEGLPTGLPTDLTSIPGLSGQCLAVANLSMTIGFLLIAPMMGSQPLTQEQVDQAFAQMGDIPADLQQPMQVLHDAAVQAVGKPVAQAAEILGSDQVSQAMDTLSKYLDDACGGS